MVGGQTGLFLDGALTCKVTCAPRGDNESLQLQGAVRETPAASQQNDPGSDSSSALCFQVLLRPLVSKRPLGWMDDLINIKQEISKIA